MKKMEGDQQGGKTWDAAAHVTRTFILYRRRSFFQRLDVWPLLLLLLFFSRMTGHELAMIAQQQAAVQQRQAAAAATRCVKTADVALLVFHVPHVTTVGRGEAAGAAAKEKWQRSIARESVMDLRKEVRLRQAGEAFEKAPMDVLSQARGTGKTSQRDTVKKSVKEEQDGWDETNEKRKRRIHNTEEEKDLFPILSWLFSSLWFVYTLALLFCGGLLHLSTHWWVSMETLVSCWRVSSVRDATHVLVVPSCSRDIEPEMLCEIESSPTQIFFFLRKKKYIYDKELGRFLSLKFPKNLPVCDYLDWGGLQATTPPAAPQLMSTTKDATALYARKPAAAKGEKYEPRGRTASSTAFPVAAVAESGTGRSVYSEANLRGKAEGGQNDKLEVLDVHGHYISPHWKGREGERLVSVIEAKYGKNEYDIPIPSFKDLFKEHAVAPFFVFQVFSISLWLLDEYWHYSVLMLVMLLFLEYQMVTKRLKDFQQLRSMRMPPFTVSVYRSGAWTRLLSDQLLPGDIFALRGRTAAGDSAVVCPVDALLLQGMIVANEASLTGESVPQTKIALDGDAEGGDISEAGNTGADKKEAEEDKNCARLDMKRRHKQHVVFAGTSVLLHRNENGVFRKVKVPEKACVAFVLRTAFSTTQGKLVRTILFSHGRVTVSSREAWLFLGILLLLALAASSYVVHASLSEGLQQQLSSRRRISSRFKLFLACSHIVMAVVPAEFPITLSLAVTMSLIFLVTKKIFCTEPFRVPYAGQVDICAFDKTGTLTSDFMRLHGVYGTGRSTPTSTNDEKEKGEAREAELEAERRRMLTAAVAARRVLGAEADLHRGAQAPKGAQSNEDNERKQGIEKLSAVLARSNQEPEKIHVLPHLLEEHVKQTLDQQLQRMFVVARHEGPGVPWCGAAAAACTSAWQERQQMGGGAAQPGDQRRRTVMDRGNGESSRKRRILVVGKGSPEVMRTFLKEVPADYDVLCRHFCLKGYRVLSLAFKEYACGEGMAGGQDVLQQLKDRRRVEEDLRFAGFLVLTCPIKDYTKENLSCIRAAGHRVVMITGDNPLTACQVARELGFFSFPLSQRHVSGSDMMLSAEQQSITNSRGSVKRQRQNHECASARQDGELELALCHAQEKQKTSERRDLQCCLFPRRVLVLRAKQHLCTGGEDITSASYPCPASYTMPTVTEAASSCPPHGRDVESGRSEFTGNHVIRREIRKDQNFVQSVVASSSPSPSKEGAQADESTAAAGESSADVSSCAGGTSTTDTHRHAAAAEAGSSPLSFGSVRSLFYWESLEGHIIAEATCVETLSEKSRGRSPVFRYSASSICTSCGGILTTCCCSSTSSSSVTFSSGTRTDTYAGSSASAAAAHSCIFSPFSATFGQSYLFSRSGGGAPLMKVPHWLAPVLSIEALAQLAATYELCITGPALDRMFAAVGATTPQHQVRLLKILVPHVAVYARMSPQQKELVIVSLNSCGHTTLMCGDGTNDVGALKAAHVGVSLLCQETAENEDSHSYKYDKSVGTCNTAHYSSKDYAEVLSGCHKSERVARGTPRGSVYGCQSPSLARRHCNTGTPSNGPYPPGSQRPLSTKTHRWQTYLEEAVQQAEAAEDPPLVSLGDASVASPFTFKGDSISGVRTILRAGRATLVTVVMMYKLMALNSVVTAFSLSVLTLDGVKLGDLQTTLENLLCTVLTLLISKTQPTTENMSTSRPIGSVFHPLVLLSLIGQAAIHCFTLHASWVLTRADRGVDWDPDIDGPFEPNLVNTVVFLLIASMHASTFLSNYEGAPFMKSLRENRPFCVTLGILLCSLGVLVFEIVPEFNTWMSLVPFPSTACKVRVIQLIAIDILGAWAIGWTTRKLCWWCARNRSKLPKFLH